MQQPAAAGWPASRCPAAAAQPHAGAPCGPGGGQQCCAYKAGRQVLPMGCRQSAPCCTSSKAICSRAGTSPYQPDKTSSVVLLPALGSAPSSSSTRTACLSPILHRQMVYQQGISVRASKAQHSMLQDCTTSKADPLLYPGSARGSDRQRCGAHRRIVVFDTVDFGNAIHEVPQGARPAVVLQGCI